MIYPLPITHYLLERVRLHYTRTTVRVYQVATWPVLPHPQPRGAGTLHRYLRTRTYVYVRNYVFSALEYAILLTPRQSRTFPNNTYLLVAVDLRLSRVREV